MRALARANRKSSFAGSSIHVSPASRRSSRSAARLTASRGRSRKTSRPSGQAGEGDHSRASGTVEPSARMAADSVRSSAVWPSSRTFAPASRAASASRAWRAARAAAGRPVAGLSPLQRSARKPTSKRSAVSAQTCVHPALSGFRPWSTVSAMTRRPCARAQSRVTSSSASESPPPDSPTASAAAEADLRRRSRIGKTAA